MITRKTWIGACAATLLVAGASRAQTAIPASFAHPKADIDTSAPGFLVRLTQANADSGELSNGIKRAEDQLAGFLIDPLTGQPYANDADFSAITLNPDGTYSELTAIDYGGSGLFSFPGIPGVAGSSVNIAMDVTTYLDLDPGTYAMTVNSDDDFRVYAGPDARDKAHSIVLGEFNDAGGRGAGDTTFSFTISQAGAYSFRLVYEQGGGGYNCSWYVGNSTNADPRILVNDVANGGVAAYQKLTTATAPYVSYLTPGPGDTGVAPTAVVTALLQDGAPATVVTNSIKVYFDNALVAATITKDTNGTLVKYDPPGLLGVLTVHTVGLVFNDSAANVSSNSYTFTVANYVNIDLPAPIVLETFEELDEPTTGPILPAGWTTQNFTTGANDPPNFDLTDPNSDAYLDWVVITDTTMKSITAWDAGLRLSHPDIVVNGNVISGIVSNKFIYAESDQRGGSQIQYLFTKDYDMTGHTNLYVSYYSMYEQNQDSIGSVEYSIDGGTNWLPIVYMIDAADIKYQADGVTIDGFATLDAEQTDTASLPDPITGDELGHKYGAFIGVTSNNWANLGPYISGRINDDGLESKRVELFKIPQADNQKTVRFRFAQAGTGSWYFGIDNLGIYSIVDVSVAPTISSISTNQVVNAGQPLALTVTATGTAPLTYQWAKDGVDITGATSATYNIASLAVTNTGIYTVTVRNAKGVDQKTVSVNVVGTGGDLKTGLVVHLPFDDNYNDTSGRGNNASAAGTPDFQNGTLGKALHVQATTDGSIENFATLGYPDDLKFTDATDFSISFWVKVTSQTDDHPFISNKNWGSSDNVGWGIFTQSGGNLRDQVTGTGGTKFSKNPAVNWKDNSWHNILVTFKRGVESVAYFDGAIILKSPLLTTGTIDTDDQSLAVNIGQDGTGAYTDGGGSSLDALIDDVGIWRRVITPEDAGTLYLLGKSGKDLGATQSAQPNIATFTLSGGQLHITVTGASGTAKLQKRTGFEAGTSWQDVGPITGNTDIPASTGTAFYRVVNP